MDLRFATADNMTNTCGAMPSQGDLGVTGARVIAPGQPAQSVLSLRMHALDGNRMPPLASSLEDTAGTALIDQWIRSTAACP
jgi:hypothetical protein